MPPDRGERPPPIRLGLGYNRKSDPSQLMKFNRTGPLTLWTIVPDALTTPHAWCIRSPANAANGGTLTFAVAFPVSSPASSTAPAVWLMLLSRFPCRWLSRR